MFHSLVVGECMERFKNMYTAIHMHSANEIKKMEENEIVFGSVNVVRKE